MDGIPRHRYVVLFGVGVLLPVALTVVVLVMQPLTGGGHPSAAPATATAGQPAHLLAVIAVLIAAAHLGGAASRWLRQPTVIGQATAGLLLGPAVLGWVAPAASRWLHAGGADVLVDALANLGVITFVFLVARELADEGHFGGARAFAIGQTMVAIPLLAGVALAAVGIAGQPPAGVSPLAYTLFIGLAMSATALPVLAHILVERRLLTHPVGALGVMSAAFGDASVWAILAVTLCFASNGDPVSVLIRLTAAAAAAAVIWWGARPLLARLLPAGRDSAYAGPALLLCGLLLSAALTDALGLHAIFGAFLFGLALPKGSAIARRLTVSVDGVTHLLLLPLFFAMVGARAHLDVFTRPSVVGTFALILVVAVVSKVASAGWAGRMVGLGWRDSAALGVMLNCRGLTELVILNVGLTSGLLDAQTFTAFFAMTLVTTAATGPLLTRLGLRGSAEDGRPGGDLHSTRRAARSAPAAAVASAAGELTD
jgi:Kef-type K+ transport system membrane component KefB